MGYRLTDINLTLMCKKKHMRKQDKDKKKIESKLEYWEFRDNYASVYKNEY